jgi:putative ABC transport system substrate-binding protein
VITRRAFIGSLAGGLLAAPLAVEAQQPGRMPRLGVLWHAGNVDEEAIFLGVLREGLGELGYIDGKNIALLNTFANEEYERFNTNAAELVRLNVDVIIAVTRPAAVAAQRATRTIPIVFVSVPDPLGSKLVASLARPGANITGLTNMGIDLAPKRLQIFKEAIAGLSRVALLVNANDPEIASHAIQEVELAARHLNLIIRPVEIRVPADLDRAFPLIAQEKLHGVLSVPDAMLYNERSRIARLALAHRLPTIGLALEHTTAGWLISYGPSLKAIFRRAATYVDKILKGATPADLPIEQPTKFELVINMQTARALGLTIPPSVLLRADEVIHP